MVSLALVLALAFPPAGFYEAKVLEPAASYVAGKPAIVYCAATAGAWATFLVETGRAGQDANGSAVVGSSEAKLSYAACSYLRVAARFPLPPSLGFAASVLTLTHESIHLRGERDEGVTDCAAVHEMPRVAVKFFRVKAGRQLRTLMAQAWAARAEEAAPYRSVC